MMNTFHKRLPARRSFIAAIVAATVLVLSATAFATVREIGDVSNFTAPACQDKTCQVLTRSTAYQQQVGAKKNASRVARPGSLVAYTVYLPKVAKKYYNGYSETYGGAPTMRISVLRAAPRKGVAYRYSLAAQSKRLNVKSYLGGTPTFVLPAPITVKRGDIIAITTDTWMPGFTVTGQDASSIWRASRPKDHCNSLIDLATERMHEKVGQIRRYTCGYKGARVLYHATVVDTPKKTNK